MSARAAVLTYYGLGAASSAVAWLLGLLLWSVITPHFFPLCLLAILLSTWYGGLGPALLAISVSTVGLSSLLLPLGPLTISHPNDAAGLIAFLVVAGLVCWLTLALRRARQRLEGEVQA